jgi:hypothetical protein
MAKGRNLTGFGCCAGRTEGSKATPEVTAVSRNGDEQVREAVMAFVREKTRALSLQGLSAEEIVARIDRRGLNRTECQLLRKIARLEAANRDETGVRESPSARS